MDPVPSKRDRDSAFFGFTRSICPSCRKVIDAHIVLRGGQVFMQKKCTAHGYFDVLISSDADYYVKSLTYTKPGTLPLGFATKVEHGCPLDCGLCEDHLQHTCSPIFEINDKCDLTCPICIVRNQQQYSISFDHFKRGVDLLIEKEGELATIFLSGGEPTLHPQFFDFVDYILRGPHAGRVRRVLVSTHGRRIANDPAFAERFKASGAYASLQFDTLRPNVYPKLRGVELIDMKMKAIDVIRELDIPTVLVPTVSKGDNSDELGDLVNFGVELAQCSSIVIQPMAHTGDGGDGFHATPAGHRLTMPEVHDLIEQRHGMAEEEHFHPVPCSHPSCYTATYLFRMNDGTLSAVAGVRRHPPVPRRHGEPSDHSHRRSAGEDDPDVHHQPVVGDQGRGTLGRHPGLPQGLPQGHLHLQESPLRRPTSSAGPRRARRRSSSTPSWTATTWTSPG